MANVHTNYEELRAPSVDAAFIVAADMELDAVPFANHADFNGDAGRAVCLAVAKNLRFKHIREPDMDLLDPQYIARGGYTNCFGYTLTGSRLLEHFDVPHLVGCYGTHACLVVHNDENDRFWMVDPLHPVLGGELDQRSIAAGDISRLSAVASIGGKAAVNFFSSDYLNALPNSEGKAKFSQKNSWFTSIRGNRIDPDARVPKPADRVHVLTVFDVTRGRNMLMRNERCAQHIFEKRWDQAADDILGLGLDYPYSDARIAHKRVNGLIVELIANKQYDTAIQVVETVYAATSEVSSDVRHGIWRADRLRQIAQASGDRQLFSAAAAGYDSCLTKTRFPSVVEAKQQKLRRLQAQT